MPSPKHWISAMRLRTLPLAAATVLAGGAAALHVSKINWLVFSFILITTLLLQILSNLSNDLGDAIKGTDDENRLGPERAIQSGVISKSQMKKMILAFVILSLGSGVTSILLAFENINLISLVFLLLGIGAIAAAMKYTLGKNPYGYSGMGDVFVFLFFGIIGVTGTDFLLSGQFHWISLLPAYAVGVFSSAVLNLNNMRDYENDKAHSKNTIVVKLGLKKAFSFHAFLILSGVLAHAYFLFALDLKIALITLLIPLAHLAYVFKNRKPKQLNGQLKVVALGTFIIMLVSFLVS